MCNLQNGIKAEITRLETTAHGNRKQGLSPQQHLTSRKGQITTLERKLALLSKPLELSLSGNLPQAGCLHKGETVETNPEFFKATALYQERDRLLAEGIAPASCWLERAKCHGRPKSFQVFYRSTQPIFEGKKRRYIGMAGSAKAKQLEQINKQIAISER